MRRISWVRHQGESLVEVMIAVTILVAVLTGVFVLLTQVSAANTNVINRVVALNMAKEGIEAVRNIRDTNWLKYSGNRRDKWLCFDTPTTQNACAGDLGNYISAGVYRIEYSETAARYFLDDMDLGGAITEKKVLPAETFRLYEEGAARRVFHSGTGKTLPFYRQVLLTPEVTKLDPVGCPGVGCPEDIRLNVVVRVQWAEGNAIRHVDLETYLYDFLGRESY